MEETPLTTDHADTDTDILENSYHQPPMHIQQQSQGTDLQTAEIQDLQTFSGQLPSFQCMTKETTDFFDVTPTKQQASQEMSLNITVKDPTSTTIQPAANREEYLDSDMQPETCESDIPNLAEIPRYFTYKTFTWLFIFWEETPILFLCSAIRDQNFSTI